MSTIKLAMTWVIWLMTSLCLTRCVDRNLGDVESSASLLEADQHMDFTNFTTHRINVQMEGVQRRPIDGLMVNFYDRDQVVPGLELVRGLVRDGSFSTDVNLGNHVSELVMVTDYIGLKDYLVVPVENLGGIAVTGYNSPFESLKTIPGQSDLNKQITSDKNTSGRSFSLSWDDIGTYDAAGVPHYLEPEGDVVTSELLSFINASLPEGRPVPTYHPDYLAAGTQTNLVIEESADVWMTFVHEGAGYRNVLGYYVYPTGEPPNSPEELETIKIAFPNASFQGSGGGLQTGDKVYLGQFEPGVTIGFTLFANGWRDGAVGLGRHQVFSNNELNPESTAENRQHSVLLWDASNELFLVGFEDLNRDSGSDNDFNDAVFYLTANPIEAISRENVNPIDKPEDSDGDGVNDTYDEFPHDSRYAYTYSYPSENGFGTFAFEDQWPGYGDYDFNDLVADYQFKRLANGTNSMVQLEANFIIRAVGAGFKNGFGFQMAISPAAISMVSGSSLRTGLFSLNSNGTEAGQTQAVIPVTDDVHRGFEGYGFINTDQSLSHQQPDTLNVIVAFSSPLALDEAGIAPFNPFLVINQERGREVHISGYAPTDLVDPGFFGQGNDNTQVAEGVYYRTKTGLPWGMNVPVSFDYPLEKVDIREGYNHFVSWSQSGGFSFMDWYIEKDGYRSPGKIFQR